MLEVAFMNSSKSPKRGWLITSMFPRRAGSGWPLALAAAIGVSAGIAAYTFSYAKGLSYFGTDPRACVNCHIMEPEYAGWQKSSHHAQARCIDCHLPESFVPKYLAKAENGYRHGKLFTTQTFEEPITVKAAGLEILQANCERCHADLVHGLIGIGEFDFGPATNEAGGQLDSRGPGVSKGSVQCVHCHWTVGHGERAGLGGPARGDEQAARSASEADTELNHE
jgi:cytochrome c nitrite reductase small subunit